MGKNSAKASSTSGKRADTRTPSDAPARRGGTVWPHSAQSPTSSRGNAPANRCSDAEVRRNRIIFALIIIALIAAIACMVHACVADDAENVDATDTESVQTDEGAPAPDSEQAPASDYGLAEFASAATSTAFDNPMIWRPAEFAVDPDRTDWNFSANGRKVVYLTIDDGPSDKTEQILDILDRYGCKATFFVIGWDSEYFPMIRKAFDKGHTIGLHSYTHDYAYVYSSEGAYYDDLDRIGEVVSEQIGFVPAFIRFPGGSSNTVSTAYSSGIMSRLTRSVQGAGYQYYDWNVSSGDGADISTENYVANCTVGANEYENIVMLMHDSAGKQSSVDGLPAVIEYWQAKGYTFEAISRDSIVVHHGVNN